MHGSEEALATLGCARPAHAATRRACSSAASAWASRCARRSICCRPRDGRRRRAGAGGGGVEPRPARAAGRASAEGSARAGRGGRRGARCVRARAAGSTPCCSTSTTGPTRSPPSRNAGSTTTAGWPRIRAALTAAACWRCGRRGRIASSSSGCVRRIHVEVERVRARLKKGGPRHTIFADGCPPARPTLAAPEPAADRLRSAGPHPLMVGRSTAVQAAYPRSFRFRPLSA